MPFTRQFSFRKTIIITKKAHLRQYFHIDISSRKIIILNLQFERLRKFTQIRLKI